MKEVLLIYIGQTFDCLKSFRFIDFLINKKTESNHESYLHHISTLIEIEYQTFNSINPSLLLFFVPSFRSVFIS